MDGKILPFHVQAGVPWFEPLDMDKDLIPVEAALSNLPPAELALPAKKRPTGKKGKIFADKSTMLKLIEEIGDRENERIQVKQNKDCEKLKIMEAREAIAARKKENKQERLKRIKEALRKKQEREEGEEGDKNGGKKDSKFGGKGKSKFQSKGSKGASVKKPSSKGVSKGGNAGKGKKVSFKE